MIGFEYKVRFHLQRGQHYMHWQIKAYDGTVKYVDPQKYQIEMYDAKLINKTNAARKVHNAGKKDVCGWVECDNFDLHEADSLPTKYMDKLSYNPIKDIHWRRGGDGGEFNWDGTDYDCLITNGNGVYVAEEGEMRKCKEYA